MQRPPANRDGWIAGVAVGDHPGREGMVMKIAGLTRRRLRAAVVALVAAAIVPVPGSSSARNVPLGGWTSERVEWIGNVTVPDPVSAELHGRYLYVTNHAVFYVFNVGDPAEPRLVSETSLGSFAELPPSSIATNGRIALLITTMRNEEPHTPGRVFLRVLDVSDKKNVRELAALHSPIDPHWTCIDRCRWAYGSSGAIVDLRSPKKPRLIEHNWRRELTLNCDGSLLCTRGVTEVRPGLVVTGTAPMFLLDTSDPARPHTVAQSNGEPYSGGLAAWPEGGSANHLISFNYLGSAMPRCELGGTVAPQGSSFDSAFATWSAAPWRAGGTGMTQPRDVYRLSNGTYLDGDPVVGSSAGWCGPVWFAVSPHYSRSGYVAIGASGHGLKFLQIDERGRIHERDWFLGIGANVQGVEWARDEVVYAIDENRGIDILRVRR